MRAAVVVEVDPIAADAVDDKGRHFLVARSSGLSVSRRTLAVSSPQRASSTR